MQHAANLLLLKLFAFAAGQTTQVGYWNSKLDSPENKRLYSEFPFTELTGG
jgi:hypothetical protein